MYRLALSCVAMAIPTNSDERLEVVRDAVGVEVRFPSWEMVGGAFGNSLLKPV